MGRLGCQFALDDFGSGFSAFFYLKNLPFDYIKIDGDFVRGLDRSPTDQLIVQAIARIADGMKIRTVAEFVTDDATLQIVKRAGVHYAQGYHIGRPGPCTRYSAWPADARTFTRSAEPADDPDTTCRRMWFGPIPGNRPRRSRFDQ